LRQTIVDLLTDPALEVKSGKDSGEGEPARIVHSSPRGC
jgi:hypothetical protein